MNIFPIGSYDVLIGMELLDLHYDVLYCHNKTFTCLDDDENERTIKGIPRSIFVRQISNLQLKKCFRKGCQLYVAHVVEPTKDKAQVLWISSVTRI
jgi:hypothetical protein